MRVQYITDPPNTIFERVRTPGPSQDRRLWWRRTLPIGNAIFQGHVAPKPLDQFSKNDTIDYVCDLTLPANIKTNPVKGGVAAHAWSCHHQASIFWLSCASLQVHLLDQATPLTAQVTTKNYVPDMVWIVEILIYFLFSPKVQKIALRPRPMEQGWKKPRFFRKSF